ncbi:prepilin-type N-terminal cleavage/methylation domain-containing protein [Coralloluteibacterium thermophilus]|uniref:Prepilin-type N-terminal cleavage/methylation domain-containing protein n=1 Tax=Coralloluteibacterium thermophilum TaxID=2707049 RepID=A0ABV9NMH7_9GAMM
MVAAPAPSRPQRGFTLIELVVTLLIVALLALAALPFARAWTDGNRQLQMRSQLMEGIGHARALALRNPHGLTTDAAGAPVEAARLAYDAGTHGLRVVQRRADGTWPTGAEPPAWQSPPLAGDVSLRLAGHGGAFRCVAFDTRGRPLGSGECALPPGVRALAVGVGNLDPLDVDLL